MQFGNKIQVKPPKKLFDNGNYDPRSTMTKMYDILLNIQKNKSDQLIEPLLKIFKHHDKLNRGYLQKHKFVSIMKEYFPKFSKIDRNFLA